VLHFGIRSRGIGGYLRTFAEPSIVMIPLNIIETFTRTFSLVVRLFGNIMSGVFIIGIILSLGGLLVPIPLWRWACSREPSRRTYSRCSRWSLSAAR
jgi:F-type H+-transporting ATPase subunit a